MPEVKVKEGEDLNGLGMILKQILDKNLQDHEKYRSIEKLKATVVIKANDADVSITLHFEDGEIHIQNDVMDKPTAYMEGGFEALADICSGVVGPIKALITRRIRARGNLFRLLKASKIMISKE